MSRETKELLWMWICGAITGGCFGWMIGKVM
jgi:hypothetical protein